MVDEGRAPVVLALREDHDGVQHDMGKARVRSLLVFLGWGDAEVRMESTARRGDFGEVARNI